MHRCGRYPRCRDLIPRDSKALFHKLTSTRIKKKKKKKLNRWAIDIDTYVFEKLRWTVAWSA
jgi:hypothetical protein